MKWKKNSYAKKFMELIEYYDLENIVNKTTSLLKHIIELILQKIKK